MSLFHSLSSSLFSATNENTLALANFNCDFSIVKVTAPREFAPVGSALTVRRRHEAENGTFHKILRRLGALFEELAPSTPLLLKAFGSRASEIIQTPRVNPQASPADGPFHSFVGADGTSVWAAATSGPASTAVLLLACMLARQFGDSKLSVALWVELISERKRAIDVTVNDNGIVPASSVIAARQDFDRRDLASLDASVRSWLCTADEAMLYRQTQMMLILKNIPTIMEISKGQFTYDKVILAWRIAMTGIEGLLGGLACEVREGAILLALSAWHLYPNMTVLSKEVKTADFKDSLFPSSAVVTVGLHGPPEDVGQGLCWSLTLSHLQNYGDPVGVGKEEDNFRVTISQLFIVVLGSLFANWGIKSEDVYLAAELIVTLQHYLSDNCSSEELDHSRKDIFLFELLAPAAQELLAAHEANDETPRLLFNHGRRRRDALFGNHLGQSIPLFGFHNPTMLKALTQQSVVECGLQYMRGMVSTTEFHMNQVLILQTLDFGSRRAVVIISTALPHFYKSRKRRHSTSEAQSFRHARWVIGHTNLSGDVLATSRFQRWAQDVEEQGESVYIIGKCKTELVLHQNNVTFLRYPNALGSSVYGRCPTLSSPDLHCQCFELTTVQHAELKYSLVFGNMSNLGLLSRTHVHRADLMEARTGNFDIQSSINLFKSGAVKSHLLLGYLSGATTGIYNSEAKYELGFLHSEESGEQLVVHLGPVDTPPGYSADEASDSEPDSWEEYLGIDMRNTFDILGIGIMTSDLLKTFHVLKTGQDVYKQFEERLIQLKVLSQPLHKVQGLQNWDSQPAWLTPSRAFMCLTIFESCSISSVPAEMMDDVMALASGDSIYVSSKMLSDPSSTQPSPSLRRIVGNIGQPGVTLLISPTRPRCRPVSEDFRAVQHNVYDFQREDNFGATSLHLFFTEWKIPIDASNKGFVDHDVHLLEAVVSIRDHGKWVADIDVLGALKEKPEIVRWSPFTNHNGCPSGNIISLDCWDEVLDPPEGVAIVRAHGNWAARLAAFCVIKQQLKPNKMFLIDGDIGCWGCVKYGSTFLID